jgi:undecaprenyl-phosphate 4-deoxy-4-formamido-L-arabinose transferase
MGGISVIIPVFNSEASLKELYQRLRKVLQPIGEFEIIMVEDGGSDQSWMIIKELANTDHNVHGIQLSRNYGQHNAILCGIRAARYETIITMDDDLQNPPEEIPKLLEKLNEGYDVVYGRPQFEQHGIWRNIASIITKFTMQNAIGAETARNISAFRAFRTRLRNAFNDYQCPLVSIDVLLTWGTRLFTAITVRHDPRRVGLSNYTFRKLMTHTINMMTGFSTFPLQIASLIGFVFTFFGCGILFYVIGVYLIYGGSVPGFPFLASIVAIFSGVQLFALGIIGEYLARIHYRMVARPAYVVLETVSKKVGV